MAQSMKSLRLMAAASIAAVFGSLASAEAQVVRAPLTDGFSRTSSIAVTVDEMLGTSKERKADEPILGPGYPDLWIAEVQYKPIRLMRLELTDPKTGNVQKELIRYMVYRVIRRDYTELAGGDRAGLEKKLADPELDPSNVLDPEPLMPLQMPRFMLETQDNGGKVLQTYTDELSVEIQNAVFAREMGRRGSNLKLLNSVEAISEIGEPIPSSDPDALLKAFYGVAVWRNVDPKADFLRVTMSGFTNAYRISGAADDRTIEEKVIVQKFQRPGDEFLQDEQELKFVDDEDVDGDKKIDIRYPMWTYRPKNVKLDIRDLDTVLRNARRETEQSPEN